MTPETAAYLKALTEWYLDRMEEATDCTAARPPIDGDPGSSPPPPPPPPSSGGG